VRTIAQRSHRLFDVPTINPVPPISSSSHRDLVSRRMVWTETALSGWRNPRSGALISTKSWRAAHHWWSKDWVLAFESFW